MAHCNQCGWDWDARVPAPAACTKCKRYDWREPKKGDGYETRRNGRGGVRVLRDNGGLPKRLMNERRETGKEFFCPNGHSRRYVKTASEKLQVELDAAKKLLEAQNGKIASLKTGKCPFCWKTVKNLSSHISIMHS